MAWTPEAEAQRAAAASNPDLTRCWSCDGAGLVQIQEVYQSAASSHQVVAAAPREERCLHCGGLGYVPKERA